MWPLQCMFDVDHDLDTVKCVSEWIYSEENLDDNSWNKRHMLNTKLPHTQLCIFDGVVIQ